MVDYILLEKYAKDKSVLFVEDDKDIIKETSELLELIFSKVDVAYDGQEAIEKYKDYYKHTNSYYDVVISDIKMPNMDGIELSKQVYNINKEQLLIVLSAHSESHYLLELVNIGISHFITKPLNYDSFVHVLYTKLKELYDNNNKDNNINSNILKINDNLSWNKETKQLLKNQQSIKLTKKEILLVELLLKYCEKTHTIEELLSVLWAEDDEKTPNISNLKNIISRLRKKIPELDLENVYGFGYRINLK
ncbi:response regulator transcription factor [Halarcobacter bivalviorum]|uniref:Transcriptional regulator n=1 Tax=Halarcobacter bivalviorum TaxID=663364 RepID=A0AAX2ABV6_9BACT|nr:response regulator transcription factor [Halarcobacter bivalviorum]AXH12258.1 two-component system response regulator, OmpR family [Halarcobacter bivalviorum]RXK11364.1 transcriptional regulator [Halarcobacter bivalviorum]